MGFLGTNLVRLSRSAVLWFWVLNFLRLAAGILLLPLLLRKLTRPDLGMYYLFVSLSGLLPVVDNAFSFNVGRFVSYAMAGAQRLQPQGIDSSESDTKPNYQLLWQLLSGTRALYGFLAFGVLLLLGTAGSVIVGLRIGETSVPVETWTAWAMTVMAAAWEVYSGWWSVFLKGMNQVSLSARLSSLSYAARLLLAGLLLAGGAGLLALPLASLVSGFLQRHLARRHCLALLSGTSQPAVQVKVGGLLRTLWPNSWRSGLKLSSLYLCTVLLAFFCLKYFGLRANGQYGLSLQIMAVIQGMAGVWIAVKWPIIGQLRARQDLAGVRRVFWARFWLQNATFAVLATVAVAFVPRLLVWIGTDKQLIPIEWFFVLALNAFLEIQFASWAMLISTENRLPTLWPTVASSIGTILLVWIFIQNGISGFGALTLGPLIIGCLFNYWFWGLYGARKLNTSWSRFVFLGPDSVPSVRLS